MEPEYIKSLKAKIEGEICYSPTHKTFFVSLIDETPQADPEVFLSTLVDKINGGGTMRSQQPAKFCNRVLYEYREESKRLPSDAHAAKMVLLNNIVLQRKE